MQWNCKRKQTITKPLRKLCYIHFHDVLSEFCVNGVSMDSCKLLWLLRSGDVVEYKVEIPIPDPLILKEGEILANEGCRGHKIDG